MGGLFVHMVDVVHWYLKVEQPAGRGVLGRHLSLRRKDRDTADNINAIVEYPGS